VALILDVVSAPVAAAIVAGLVLILLACVLAKCLRRRRDGSGGGGSIDVEGANANGTAIIEAHGPSAPPKSQVMCGVACCTSALGECVFADKVMAEGSPEEPPVAANGPYPVLIMTRRGAREGPYPV